MQVVVQLAVDKSREVCSAVAKGDVDVAIIGGHVPNELKDVLQVIRHKASHLAVHLSPACCVRSASCCCLSTPTRAVIVCTNSESRTHSLLWVAQIG